MNTIDEAIEILQAMKEGKQIQVYIENEWKNSALKKSVPNFFELTYRIKPEPLEIWVNVYPDETLAAHETKSLAEEYCHPSGKTVHFREVIEE